MGRDAEKDQCTLGIRMDLVDRESKTQMYWYEDLEL